MIYVLLFQHVVPSVWTDAGYWMLVTGYWSLDTAY
jgi:hypothetical protein